MILTLRIRNLDLLIKMFFLGKWTRTSKGYCILLNSSSSQKINWLNIGLKIKNWNNNWNWNQNVASWAFEYHINNFFIIKLSFIGLLISNCIILLNLVHPLRLKVFEKKWTQSAAKKTIYLAFHWLNIPQINLKTS